MDRTKSADSEDPRPELGLQFNPASPNVAGQTNEAVTDPIGDSQEQEIVVGTAGKAILLGEEIDLESDNGDDQQQLLINQSSKSGRCPIWLNGASPFTKGVLGFFAIVLLAFVGMLIAGVVQLSSPSSGNDGGGASSIQADENAATDPTKPLLPVDVPAAISTPSPTPKPIPSLATASSSPTPAIVIIPISESKVNVALPSYLEMKVPNFADGLNTEEVDNWNLIEDAIETAIFSSLTEELPTEYKLEAIQVDKFDVFSTSSISKRTRGRNMMREGLRNQNQLDESDETIHTVVYSTSVTVNCLEVSDCTEVPDTIDSATSYLSEVEYIQVLVENPAPVAPLPPITDKPSPSPIVVTPVPTTPAPTTSRSPTAGPTKAPTKAPVTAAPTLPVTLSSRQDECTEYAPCEQCLGKKVAKYRIERKMIL